MTTYAVKR